MMDYKEYKEFAIDFLQKQFGESAEVSLMEVNRGNDTRKEAILVRNKEDSLSPLIYLDSLYEEYRQTGNLQDGMNRCITECAERESIKDTSLLYDWEYIRPRVGIRLIGKERNREYLQDKVYNEMLDLAVLFTVTLKQEQDKGAFMPVTKGLMENGRFDREALQEAAWENLRKEEFPIHSMGEMIRQSQEEAGGECFAGGIPDTGLYVVTNEQRLFGARVMCRKDILRAFAEGIGGNLYILPSSVHELILLKDDGEVGADWMKEVVQEINSDGALVKAEDVLSDSVYYYDRGMGELRIAE